MPFREKTAWISFVTMLVVFGGYFGAILTGAIDSMGIGTLHFLMLSVAAVVILQLGATFAAMVFSRDDPKSPRDERERLIELKATRIAFYVLVVAVLSGTFVFIHLPVAGRPLRAPEMGLVVMAAIVIADLARNAAQIAYFRRGG